MINWNVYADKLQAMANRVTTIVGRRLNMESLDEKTIEEEIRKLKVFKQHLLKLSAEARKNYRETE